MTFNVTDHEGFNSADEMHRLVLEVVENFNDEEVVVDHLSAIDF